MRQLFVLILLLSEIAVCRPVAVAQDSDTLSQAAVCTFSDDKQMTIRYTSATFDKKNPLPFGKIWTPGGTPMALFTEAGLVINCTADRVLRLTPPLIVTAGEVDEAVDILDRALGAA